ncbi:hypothetical protein ABI59_19315 [Acidobacteria bacterium Mor1]|nr:hypothetical protein ABI59_19315 [Acidobacteria bacterium Mor1]
MQALEHPRWSCLSNHGLVLVALGRGGTVRIRDLAVRVGLTERAVQRIVTELAEAGLIRRERQGRCNLYRIDRARTLSHPLESHRTVGDLIDAFDGADNAAATA